MAEQLYWIALDYIGLLNKLATECIVIISDTRETKDKTFEFLKKQQQLFKASSHCPTLS